MMTENNETEAEETDNERAVRRLMTSGFFRAQLDGAVVSMTDSSVEKSEDSDEPRVRSLKRTVGFTGNINFAMQHLRFSNCPIIIEFWEKNPFGSGTFANERGDAIIGHAVTVPQSAEEKPLIEVTIPASPEMLDEWLRVAYQIGKSRIGFIGAKIGFLGIDQNQKLEPTTEISFWITHLTLNVKFEARISDDADIEENGEVLSDV